MKLILRILTSSLLLLLALPASSQSIHKETLQYAIKGSDTLRLSHYVAASNDTSKPCFIFVFGGGFVGGSRNDKQYTPFFYYLAQKGFEVVAIDYRLGLQALVSQLSAQHAQGKPIPFKPAYFAQHLVSAINLAVEDLYDATRFVLQKSKAWKIDTSQILIGGSSAGAITALHAEYYRCSKHELASILPKKFHYAGIVACAGAIFLTKGDLNWNEKPAPILMFHGNSDQNVPFATAKIGPLHFYGSQTIAENLSKIQSPHCFYAEDYGTHTLASSPLFDYRNEFQQFFERLIVRKQPLIIHSKLQEIGRPVRPTRFSIIDYVKGNFERK